MKTIAVLGTGYVGLVTATCLADFGHHVIGLDINPDKIALLKTGKSPIFEPGLEALIVKNLEAKRLRFSTDLASELPNADIVFTAVGTPPNPDGSANLTYLFQAVDTIATAIKTKSTRTIVVNKSTVPVGTCKRIQTQLLNAGVPQTHFAVISNPEFLREGCALDDFFEPDRVVLGGTSDEALAEIEALYKPLDHHDVPILKTSLESAELIKYAANAFLATKISFINDMARLSEAVGANVHDISKGMGLDHRIGKFFLNPGPGYGGSCFPKDTQALLQVGQAHGVDLKIVSAAQTVNDEQKQWVLNKITTILGSVSGKTIGILGLAFKANTDDIRESSALTIVEGLLKLGATIQCYDPEAMPHFKALYPTLTYTQNPYEALQNADLFVLLTDWNEFKELDFDLIKTTQNSPIVFDTRNIYKRSVLTQKGFTYYGVGQ